MLTKSSANDLERYRDKRDPSRTNEPFAAERINRAQETWQGDFVVHQHGARRMHFDLRIEMGGTLASFAVPRGPSLDPADKRLAVQTENHPIEYLDFEDVIPEGNYGAGPMIVWDLGRVQYLEHPAEQGEQTGKIDFVLAGQKLKGRFALVLTGKSKDPEERGQRQWLLLKKPDEHSRVGEQEITERQPYSVLSGLKIDEVGKRAEISAALLAEAEALGAKPGNVATADLVPMLASLRAATQRKQAGDGARARQRGAEGGGLHQSPENLADLVEKGRLFELKLDGVRIIADKHVENVALRYRSLRPAGNNYPEVVRAVRALAPDRVVLDGEIVTFDDRGRPSFQRLAPRIHARLPADVNAARITTPINYVVFDLLQLGPYDLRPLPLIERKRLLKKLLPGRGVMWALDHLENDGRPLFDWCKRQGLEGVVSKLAKGPYRAGPARTTDWIKLKCDHEEEFVVVGWLSGKGSRERLGALELGSWDGQGWIYRGRVGSGLSDDSIDELLRLLEPLRRDTDPAQGEPLPYQGQLFFVEPALVVRVSYLEWTPDDRLRMAVFLGIRHDIEPRSCRAAPTDHAIEAAEEAAIEAPVVIPSAAL
ncbi:MAG TPA: non-homologous end-joining DNA ligase, partial [Polyangiaceae bacterium]|nr:non-homologous end-joining DNA ligase [Polyangiaceae bacterium]